MYPLRLILHPLTKELRLLYHSSKYSPKAATKIKKAKPNIKKQVEEVDYTSEGFDEDGFENLNDEELNISDSGELLDAHYREVKSIARKRELAMYGQKFYKPPKEPHLLTWADKDQIRHLHNNEKWPVEVLANSFPASELIIKKILKTEYSKDFQSKLKYDQIVEKNWELLKKGKLKISDELRQHCLKFTARRALPVTSKDVVVSNTPNYDVKGVFSAMLKRAGHEKEKNEEETKPDFQSKDLLSQEALMQKIRMKTITLEEARKRELELIANKEVVSDKTKAFVLGGAESDLLSKNNENRMFTETVQNHSPSVVTKVKSTSDIIHDKWDSSGGSMEAARDALQAPIDDYPEHINIPERVKKPGAIYRVEDCFYDENGDFLYRVPGLKL